MRERGGSGEWSEGGWISDGGGDNGNGGGRRMGNDGGDDGGEHGDVEGGWMRSDA